MRKIAVVLLLLPVLCLICAGIIFAEVPEGSWPQFQRDEVNSGITTDLAPANSPVMIWSQFIYHNSGIGVEVVPIIADNTVFVLAGTKLCAINKDTGKIIWQANMTGHGTLQVSTPAYGEGKLFLATFDGYVFAFDAKTGAELWSKKVALVNFQCPVTCHNGRLYIGEGGTGGETNRYFCLDAADGRIIWEYSSPTSGYLWCGASITGNCVVFGNVDGVLTSLDKETGNLIDKLDLKDIRPDTGRIRASVSYCDGYVYTTSESGWEVGYAWKVGFDPETGRFLEPGWVVPIGFSTSTPAVHKGRVYVGQGEHGFPGRLLCLDDSSSEILWFCPTPRGVKSSPALSVCEDKAYAYFTDARNDGSIFCVRDDGTLAWEWNPPDEGYVLQGAAISGGRIFFGTSGGYLYCLGTAPDWDINCDGSINILDVTSVGLHWSETGEPGWIREDVNNDGIVNILDVAVIGLHWGETGSAGWIKEDVNDDGVVNVLDMILVAQNFGG
jgi:outer membrane protein assembly factor BamB